MSLPKHLDDAVSRLREALYRLEGARAKPLALESLRDWLEALTDYTTTLCDIHSLNNESIHEKLHQIASQVGLKEL